MISGAMCGFDAGGECGASFVVAREAREHLAVLEVAGDIVRVRRQKLLKMLLRGGRVVLIGAFDGQAVEGKGVIGMRSDKLLQHGAAAFLLLWFSHNFRGLQVEPTPGERVL